MRKDAKRITVELDGETYRRLKLSGFENGKTNQEMAETAIREYLARIAA